MFFKDTVLAVDIGSSSVKIVEMAGGKSKKLHGLAYELLPRGVIEGGLIRDPEMIAKAIQSAMKKQKIKGGKRKIAVSVSGVATLIKRATIAIADDSEADELIYEEAKQLFHHNLEDMYFRFQEIPSAFVDKGQKAFILVAAKIETVEQYVDLAHRIGMKVGVTDCDVFCLNNMFDFNYPVADALSLAINIGASSTQIVFSYNGEFLYSREIFIGGNDYTIKIAEEMQIDFDNAESFKVSASAGDPALADKIRPIVKDINNQFVGELSNTINYFQTEEMPGRFERVNLIFLCGGAAGTLDLSSAIATYFRAPVQVINPFHQVDIEASGVGVDYIMTQGNLYGIAMGLSLRDWKIAAKK